MGLGGELRWDRDLFFFIRLKIFVRKIGKGGRRF